MAKLSDLYKGPQAILGIQSLTDEQVEAWQAFARQNPHELLLKLNWLMRRVATQKQMMTRASRGDLSVLWHLVSTYLLSGKPPNTPCVLSDRDWLSRYGQYFGSNGQVRILVSSITQRLSNTRWIELRNIDSAGKVHTRRDNTRVSRVRWLNWPALLADWQSTQWPPLNVLEMYWFAQDSDLATLILAFIKSREHQADPDGFVMVRATAITEAFGSSIWLSPTELVSIYRRILVMASKPHSIRDRFIERDRSREQVVGEHALRIKPGELEKNWSEFYNTDIVKF